MDNSDEIVELNVGGQHFSTTRATLTRDPDSILAAMFTGGHAILRDRTGRYFLDCDAEVFRHVLEFLRFGTLPPRQFYRTLEQYATVYGLQSLTDALKKVPIVEVNLRGHHLTIAKETVSDIQDRFHESNLAGIFSGGEDLPRDSAGRYFIDANAEEFKLLLDTVKYNRKCTTNRVLWVKAYFQHYLGLVGSQLRKYF